MKTPSILSANNHPSALSGNTLAVLSASVLSLIPSAALASTLPVTVLADRVNVRAQASLEGAPVAQLKKGELLQMVDSIASTASTKGTPSRWAAIQLPLRIPVYVSASFVKGDTVKASQLNIRLGPGENYGVIGRLKKGDKVSVVSRKAGWLQILPTDQARAYVAADYLSVPASTPAIPVTPMAPAHLVVTKQAPLKPAGLVALVVAPAAVNNERASVKTTPVVVNERPHIDVAQGTGVSTTQQQLAPPFSQKVPTAVVAISSPAPVIQPVEATNEVPVILPAVVSGPAEAVVFPTAATEPVPAPNEEISASPLLLASEEGFLNRVSVSYRFQMNVSARFNSQTPALGSPLAAGQYQNGYVLPSSRQGGASDGLTWNWGYQHADQIHGDQLWLDRASVPAGSSSFETDNNRSPNGAELNYSRILYKGGKMKENLLGFECAVNYSGLNFKETSQQSLSLVQTTDKFALGGVVPPLAPYNGTFIGPGALLPLDPASSSSALIPNAGNLSSFREFSADVYGLRLGPTYDRAIQRLRIGVSGGLAVLGVDSEFQYRDSWSGMATGSQSSSSSKFDLLPGWYVAGNLNFAITPRVGLFYNLQFQNISDFSRSVDGRTVTIDQQNSLFHAVGISYSF